VHPSPTDTPRHINRLAQESSPYLLQHRHNPVDWYPWGPEAFAAARAQNKPIFLSVGYSTCYWCHVMERQSFENEAVAGEMNARFINIKVDREERPDVDGLYMTAVQLLTRQGGWPMSVFLTPDLRPFYGGTYYPPTDSYGRPGFVSLLRGIDDAWRNRPGDVEKTAEQLQSALRRYALPAPGEPVTVDRQWVDQLVRRSVADYEPHYGGFGHAPKFPRETLLELLLTYLTTNPAPTSAAASPEPRSTIEHVLRHTLESMARGGIRDQLGHAFHRYSTDARWLVPHFEIMLYDNAMLGWVYAEAFRQFADPRYSAVARGIFDFVLGQMTSPEGAFYTALDAEVDGQEGMPYLWTAAEVEAVLGKEDAARFNQVYGVALGPNFADPHNGNGVPDKNVLFIVDDYEHDAYFNPDLAALAQKLLAARLQRKQPLLDTKILTSWNALMIRALAHGGQVLEHRRYIQAAEKAAGFLLSRHRTPSEGLYRTSRDGTAKYNAFLDDYSFLAQALIALADASGEPRWRDEATATTTVMKEKFRDAGTGGFYFTDADATDLIVRQMASSDSPLPSGNAVAAMALLETGQAQDARSVLATFAGHLDGHAEGMSSMVQAAQMYLSKHAPFTVTAEPSAAQADRPLPPAKIAEGVVQIKPHWATPTDLHVRLTILDGFHINAHDPQGGDVPLVPTNLTITDSYGAPADIELIDYPPGEEQAFAFTDKPIRVYTGDAVIAVRFKGVTVGGGPLKLNISYQACDESACLPAVMKTIEVEPK
jgi:uncharacterized protein YyaL (SSP411 family)